MKKILSLILIAMLLILACACSEEATEEPKPDYTATADDIAKLEALYANREAYHGNLHDHSDSGDPENDPWKTADGKFPLSVWTSSLIEKDLDFVALVDHRQTNHMRRTAWDNATFIGGTETGHRRLDDTGEIDPFHYNILLNDPDALDRILSSFSKFNHTGKGHFKIYSNNPLTEDEFSQMVTMVQEAGGNVVHVHPCYKDPETGEGYMTSEDIMDYYLGEYTGIEVLLGYRDGDMRSDYNKDAYNLWVEFLNAGKHLYAFAGSDSHKSADTQSASTVYAEERMNTSYLSHIVKGDFTAGPVGIRMCVGDTVMGGHTAFTGKRLIVSVDDFQSQQYHKDHQYRIDVYNEKGLVFSQEFDSTKTAYFAIDAEDCKYYRADVYDVTDDYIVAIGNPIWNEP